MRIEHRELRIGQIRPILDTKLRSRPVTDAGLGHLAGLPHLRRDPSHGPAKRYPYGPVSVSGARERGLSRLNNDGEGEDATLATLAFDFRQLGVFWCLRRTFEFDPVAVRVRNRKVPHCVSDERL